MPKELQPEQTPRAAAYARWMKAPNPMVTLFKTFDVTNLVRISQKKHLKFNMLLCYCIGRAASPVETFYTLPVGEKLMQFDALAISVIVMTRTGSISSCDIPFSDDLTRFDLKYRKITEQTVENGTEHDLSETHMVIGTSAITETELDGAVGMNSGVYNNPFLIWGRTRQKRFRCSLPVSFQFHHTQMDGVHAGRFLENLQKEINQLKP